MKTLKLTKSFMDKRMSRFLELEPLQIQIDKTVTKLANILSTPESYYQ
ncbi:hypothetical protein OAI86_02075 [Alphaproteobacteria bacterium]|nr:hypothetical protein [Alphaproteobacteria bacterium]